MRLVLEAHFTMLICLYRMGKQSFLDVTALAFILKSLIRKVGRHWSDSILRFGELTSRNCDKFNLPNSLIERNDTAFDNRGRAYQATRYGVDPSTGTVGNSLANNTWYDATSNVI